ncbi:MAG: Calx-beta domain-containing protein [Snowella sp.]|nr:Calx-beta domain-containing protein [Snowella sp.]
MDEVTYTINLSSNQQGIQYNFAYIIDVSGSMSGSPLTQAKNAYSSLTDFLIGNGIADISQFVVIPFSSTSSRTNPMDAEDTKTTINGLSASGRTNFEAPLKQALQFFGGLSGGATNIVYFLSDGQGSGSYNDEATELQKIADVRAFGIGGANLSTLNIIDSGDAVLLSDPTQLQAEFQKSGFSKDDITEIKIFLDIDPNDTIAPIQVDTILPDQLQDSTLGLSVTGKISGLNTSVNAQNKISAEVVFNDGTPNTIVDFTINTDQGKGSPTDQNDRLSFAPTQKEIDAGAGDDEIVANDLANTIYTGDGNDIVFAAGGNDTIYPSLGDNRIDGGDGIDTVVYTETLAQRGPVNKVGGLIKVGTGTDTLSNVEFIQFADTRISTQTLLPVPILSGQNISVVEGNSGQLTTIDFAVSLSSVAQENVTFSYQTFDGSATTGVDYNQGSGQIIVPVGSSDAIITVEIIGDNQFEFDEDFGIVLSQLSGASFDGNGNELTLFAAIENDDNAQPADIFLTNETIPENLPIETVLGQFFTTDPDGDTQFSYTFVNGEGDTDNEIFTINANELLSTQSFDFEIKNSYSIRVQTDDGNGGIFEKIFTITVSDLNETSGNQAPTALAFQNLVTGLAENSDTTGGIKVADIAIADDGQGTNILSLSGTDKDSFEIRNNALFFIGSSPDFGHWFSLIKSVKACCVGIREKKKSI